jgi:hypothetical protein
VQPFAELQGYTEPYGHRKKEETINEPAYCPIKFTVLLMKIQFIVRRTGEISFTVDAQY